MTQLMTKIRAAADKRRRYQATRNEIARMPRDVALDLDMFPEDADLIARRAVYG